MNKWLDGDRSLKNDKRRIVMEFGKCKISEKEERLALWILLPETITPEEMEILVVELKMTCEKCLKINDISNDLTIN
jgi:hypothetical protein